MKKCIFLDRDGTINVEKHYLHKIEDFEWEYKAKEAIKMIKKKGYIIVVVSNQSGIARGYYNQEDVVKLHDFMNKELQKIGTEIDAFYFCPHHPNGINEFGKRCNCRKPEVGMFEEAKKSLNIDYAMSYMVGDKKSDLDSALRLGISGALVKTGHGIEELIKIDNSVPVYENLYEFAKKL